MLINLMFISLVEYYTLIITIIVVYGFLLNKLS